MSHKNQLKTLESCAAQSGWLQTFHPSLKLASSLCFAVCAASCTPQQFPIFAPYGLLLIILLASSKIPLKLFFIRLAIALPFSIFAGLWGCFYDTQIVAQIGSIPISSGVISLIAIIIRTLLSVGIILILAGTTPVHAISMGLRTLHCPREIAILLELIWRYLGILFDETDRIHKAWLLRKGSSRGIPLKHFGSLCGGLFLRSYDRASRIYQAMKCRGYPTDHPPRLRPPFPSEWFSTATFIILCLILRFSAQILSLPCFK